MSRFFDLTYEIFSKFHQPCFLATDSLAFLAKADYLHTRRNFPITSEPSKLHLRKFALKQIDETLKFVCLSYWEKKKDRLHCLYCLCKNLTEGVFEGLIGNYESEDK